MVKRIEWSQTATAELGQILTYLRFEVSYQTALNFSEVLQKRIDLLIFQLDQRTNSDSRLIYHPQSRCDLRQ